MPKRPAGPPPHARALSAQNHLPLVARPTLGSPATEQLGNSLHLTESDREYLTYVPHSTLAKHAGKPWKWSFPRYLHSDVAARSPILMRLLLAYAATELEGRASTDPDLAGLTVTRTRWAGATHYNTALHEFCTLLATCNGQPMMPADIDEIIASFYIMISLEAHSGTTSSGLMAHLSGVQAFLEASKIVSLPTGEIKRELSKVSKTLLLYIL